MVSQAEIFCTYCEIRFSSKSNLYKHLKRMHNVEDLPIALNQICPKCDYRCRKTVDIHEHIKTDHKEIQLNFEAKTFHTEEDFQIWLRGIELKNTCSYVFRSSIKLSDGATCRYYHCNRSGESKLKSDRKRKVKFNGPVKTGKTCPSTIKTHTLVINEAVEIEVEYQSVHVGHELDVSKRRMKRSERMYVAKLLQQFTEASKVISHVKKLHPPTTRLGLINYQDVRNIRKDFSKVILQHNNKEQISNVLFQQQEDTNELVVDIDYKEEQELVKQSFEELKAGVLGNVKDLLSQVRPENLDLVKNFNKYVVELKLQLDKSKSQDTNLQKPINL